MTNKLIKNGALVFDIGANVGQTTMQLLHNGAAKVVSVEPCWKNYILIPRKPNVTFPIHAACWNKPDILAVRYATTQNGLSTVKHDVWSKCYPDEEWDEPEMVVAVTLDQLKEKFGEPQAVKIDVEGAEFEVIQGMNFKPQVLFFEFHRKQVQAAERCLQRLLKLGFSRAHYTREHIDLGTVPTMSIGDFTPRWRKDDPEWGNITVI